MTNHPDLLAAVLVLGFAGALTGGLTTEATKWWARWRK